MARKPRQHSTIRRESAAQRRRRLKIAKGHCTWCAKPVKPPAIHWCRGVPGNSCFEQFQMVNDVAFIRAKVEERDKGICALCGSDPAEWERLWYHFRCEAQMFHQRIAQQWRDRAVAFGCRCLWCVATREAAQLRNWQADHIRPVVEGGGQCGLENYRTLCLCCHKRETAKLAARRARKRKAAS